MAESLKSASLHHGTARNLIAMVFGILLVASNLPAVAQTLEEDLRSADVEHVVQMLGADTFAERQAAMQEVINRDLEAVEPLRQVALQNESDPEAQMRAVAVLARLAVVGEQECQTAARAALTELIASDDSNLRKFAGAAQSRLSEAMHDVAISQLRKFGADVDSSTYRDGQKQVTRYELTIDENWTGELEDFSLASLVSRMDHLNLYGEQITDEVIDRVSAASLRTLVVKRASISNAAIDRIRKIDSLRTLYIYYCDIDDDCVEDLATMDQLRQIRLYGTKISRNRVGQLARGLGIQIDLRNGAFLGIYYNSDQDEPLQITRVVQGSAAEKGGIRTGDIVTYFGDRDITSASEFGAAIQACHPGDTVTALVQRDDKEVELQIELGRFPDRDR
ncbi:MAG: PDZ domain-containing protein [Pirellulaceae bacterium]